MINIYEKILELKKKNVESVLITVVDKSGEGPTTPGSKLIVTNDNIIGTIGGGNLENIAIEKAKELLKNFSKKTCIIKYDLNNNNHNNYHETGMVCGGYVTLYYEKLTKTSNIFIFGAGHIGKALGYHLKPFNFNITIIDERPEMFKDFHDFNNKIIDNYKNIIPKIKLNENDFILIATHSHSIDFMILDQIFHNNVKVKYLGVVASKNKSSEFINELNKKYKNINYSNIYMPVGLNIAKITPHEIALSIISEMLSIENNKKTIKSLRNF